MPLKTGKLSTGKLATGHLRDKAKKAKAASGSRQKEAAAKRKSERKKRVKAKKAADKADQAARREIDTDILGKARREREAKAKADREAKAKADEQARDEAKERAEDAQIEPQPIKDDGTLVGKINVETLDLYNGYLAATGPILATIQAKVNAGQAALSGLVPPGDDEAQEACDGLFAVLYEHLPALTIPPNLDGLVSIFHKGKRD